MRVERYTPTDQGLKRELQNERLMTEGLRDFIEFLFDHSEHCDHITYQEAWDEFQEWLNKDQNAQPSVASKET